MRLPAILAALLVLSAAVSAHPVTLFGEVGGRPVLAVIDDTGGTLDGWYAYTAYGKQIMLAGRLDPAGAFALDETTDRVKTGRFQGTAAHGTWTGTWAKPDGTAPHPFSLTEAGSDLAGVSGEFRCATTHTDKQYGWTYRHSIDLVLSQGAVMRFEADRTAQSTQGDMQSCSIGLNDMLRVPAAVGITLQSRGDDPKHAVPVPGCTVRIIGDANTLYVGMGDGTGTDNDCRQSETMVYCSPRGSWTDMVMDRRTRRCRSIE